MVKGRPGGDKPVSDWLLPGGDLLAGGRFGRGQRVGRVAGVAVWVLLSLLTVHPEDRAIAAALVAAGGTAVLLTGFVRRYWWLPVAGVTVFTLSGLALLAAGFGSVGWVPPMFGAFWAIARFPARPALAYAVSTLVALLVVGWVAQGPGAALGMVGGCLGAAFLAYSIRTARVRAVTAERLLASERAAREATARAEVLAERGRLAREIHDILAHTLSAQVVQLEGARLLLGRAAPAEAVLERVERAQRLAREGLDETRQALDSLRGRTRPVDEAVRVLAAESDATFRLEGPVRELGPERSVAIVRTVQEALTNVRKHAPGAAVSVLLRYRQDEAGVEVSDAGRDGTGALTGTGGGYGLTGMRERAELLGGTLRAGPLDTGGFRVRLTLPG